MICCLKIAYKYGFGAEDIYVPLHPNHPNKQYILAVISLTLGSVILVSVALLDTDTSKSSSLVHSDDSLLLLEYTSDASLFVEVTVLLDCGTFYLFSIPFSRLTEVVNFFIP